MLRWLVRAGGVLVSVAVVDYLVLPRLAGTGRALELVGGIPPAAAVLAVALEVASLAAYSSMTRSVLPTGRARYGWLLRSDVVGLGVSHVLPGGAASASALRYRLLREGGSQPEDVAVGLAWQGVESTLVLVVLLWASLVVSIPLAGVHPAYVAVAVAGAVVIAAAVVTLVLRHDRTAPAAAPAWLLDRVPGRWRVQATRALTEMSDRLHEVLADHRGLRISAAWSTASWLLDAATLAVLLGAFGHWVDPVELFVAYGLANAVAVLPITPGGLGVVEGVLIPSLVGFGVPPAVAVLGVVSWRVLDFWAPIPAAAGCYLSLRLASRRHPPAAVPA